MGHLILDRFHFALRQMKLSKTKHRDDFCLALHSLGRTTADELSKQLPDMTYLAFHRTLKFMTDAGFVVGLSDGTYDLREPLRQHRHYLRCTSCGKTQAFNDVKLEKALEGVVSKHKMNIKNHRVELVGLCEGCNK
jgi:Fur family ferric uptake transcriptional regulator